MQRVATERWVVREPHPAEETLQSELGIQRLLAAALVDRGITDPEGAGEFLNPSLDSMHDPRLLPNCEEAVRILMDAREKNQRVFVHGDYDVDGVTSTAIWARALRRLGFDVLPHVPHRIKHGFGVHEDAVFEAMQQGAKVLLTCDCGSSAIEAVKRAKQFGMRVVLTDHHEFGSEVPAADAIVNPHLPDNKYPFPHLSGAGVAFKVAQRVSEECGATAQQFQRAFLDLACVGTIADVVPLHGENRVIAHFGLKVLSRTKKVGLEALMRVAQIEPGAKATSYDVAWRLGPRLNAAGRVDDAAIALQLMLTEDPEEARALAQRLDELNEERRSEEMRILEQAEEAIQELNLADEPLIMVFAEGWHRGVVGIVASRICEKYNRPALLAAVDPETGLAHGSARSPETFNLHEALMLHRELFRSCGGHARAAGFSVTSDALEEVRSALVRHAGEVLRPEDLIPTRRAIAAVTPAEVVHRSFIELERLEPLGEANPKPLFFMPRVRLLEVQPTSNAEHVRFRVEAPKPVYGIGFRSAQLFEGVRPGDTVDLLFRAAINRYNGNEYPQLILEGLRPAVE